MLKTQPHPRVQSRHALNDRRQGRMMGSVRRSDEVVAMFGYILNMRFLLIENRVLAWHYGYTQQRS